MHPSGPTLSVITVCYNGARHLEKTLQSVLGQTYPHIEYWVIDGASTDGSVDIIERYADRLAGWISEPDKGLYDAMQKGQDRATGDFILFQNVGDLFYNERTVENVFANYQGEDFLYGDTVIINDAGEELGMRVHKRLPRQLSAASFRWGMVVGHQAMFVRRSLCGPFRQQQYPCSSDLDWAIVAARRAQKFKNVHTIVSRYLFGGNSHVQRKKCLKERWSILRKHYGLLTTLSIHLLIAIKFALGGFRIR
ncbi:MAG: glycosyltransferase [Bacteroidetes bacterium]|jgi:glycosyltransferase involved in cell wall biosynthesis|nr:glycosyltransferase [Bacteroidota bacterium]